MFRAWFHESPLWYRENAQTVPCVTAIGLSYKAHWDCKFALVGPCMIPEWPVNGDIMNDLFITEWKHWQSQSVLHQTLWAVSCNSSIFISVFSVEHASSGHFWPPLLGWFSCYFSEAVLCFQVYVLYVCFFLGCLLYWGACLWLFCSHQKSLYIFRCSFTFAPDIDLLTGTVHLKLPTALKLITIHTSSAITCLLLNISIFIGLNWTLVYFKTLFQIS